MEEAVEIFKALADARRLRIAVLLTDKELCVCELVGSLCLPQYVVSRSLSGLRRSGIVSLRKEGKWVYYSIAPDVKELLHQLVSSLCAHYSSSIFDEDAARLERRLRFRVDGKCIYGLEAGDCCGSSDFVASAEMSRNG